MIPLKLTKKFVIVAGYGMRTHPIYKKKMMHYGVDLTCGEEILATQNGKVVKVVNKGKNMGTMCQVRIQHKDYQSAYYHCLSGSARVKVGDFVNAGDHIATTGNTGVSTGRHLHFQIDKGSNETSIDPTEYAKGDKELVGLLDLKLGQYTVVSPRYVRTGYGTNYSIKKVKELPKECQKNCKNTKQNAKAQYKKGVTFTVKTLKYSPNGAVWGETASGWLCLRSHSGVNYCKKK